MTTINVINEVSTLTKVPAKAINNVLEKEMFCIGSAIHDAKLNNEDVVTFNIGLGTLCVELNTMQCKLIPSKVFKDIIKKSSVDNIDPLAYKIEQTLINKLIAISDEVL